MHYANMAPQLFNDEDKHLSNVMQYIYKGSSIKIKTISPYNNGLLKNRMTYQTHK